MAQGTARSNSVLVLLIGSFLKYNSQDSVNTLIHSAN